jgi:hypothetical protein
MATTSCSQIRFRAGVLLVTAITVLPSASQAGGILGRAVKDFGNLVGSEDVKRFGENLDAEHRRFKNRDGELNKIYKEIEEGGSRLVRESFAQVCIAPFEALTKSTMARCANWDGRMEYMTAVNRSKQMLIDAGVATTKDFEGVKIRWCPLTGAHGMAPDRGMILLDTRYRGEPIEELAALLAHELKHIMQYRKMGSNAFKCAYSREYVECGGCQGRGHRLERQAYEFEDEAYRKVQKLGADKGSPDSESRGAGSERARASAVITDECVINDVRVQIDEYDRVHPYGRVEAPGDHPRCAFDIVPRNDGFAFCVNRADGAVLSRDRRGWYSVGYCRRVW